MSCHEVNQRARYSLPVLYLLLCWDIHIECAGTGFCAVHDIVCIERRAGLSFECRTVVDHCGSSLSSDGHEYSGYYVVRLCRCEDSVPSKLVLHFCDRIGVERHRERLTDLSRLIRLIDARGSHKANSKPECVPAQPTGKIGEQPPTRAIIVGDQTGVNPL